MQRGPQIPISIIRDPTVSNMAESSADGHLPALSKLRTLLNSKLENQKNPAQLLVAIEQSLDESQKDNQNASSTSMHATTERSAGEYYFALEGMVEKALSDEAPPSLLPSTFYILSLITPHVSAGILKSRVASLLPAVYYVLSNPHPRKAASAESHSALLRSALSIFQAVLAPLSKDRGLLQSEPQLRSCWDATLNLCVDARPKVRRRAQEVIQQLIAGEDEEHSSSKPHVFAGRTAEWTSRTLASVSQAGGVSKPGKQQQESKAKYDVKKGKATGAQEAAKQRQADVAGGASVGIWVCTFLKTIAIKLPEKYIPQLCEDLLRLPGLQNPFLTVTTFEVFESLFEPSRPATSSASSLTGSGATLAVASATASSSTSTQQPPNSLVRTLDALNSSALRPNTSDVQLLPAYLRALEGALVAYARYDSGKPAWTLFPKIWDDIIGISLSAKSDASRSSIGVRTAGRDALASLVRYCIPEDAIREAVAVDVSEKTTLGKMIQSIDDALSKHALRFAHSRGEIFSVLAAFITKLRLRIGNGTGSDAAIPAAAKLLMPLVKTVADMRQTPKFLLKEQADLVLAAATEVCGPEAVLDMLPLNLLNEEGPTKEGRAWLLPLMRGKITNAKLSHFVSHIVPLSEKLFNARAEAESSQGRGVEAKMYEALIEQLWALFPGYCDLPVDLTKSLTTQFAGMLATVASTQKNLRPSVLRGLTLLVERNESLARSGAPDEILQLSFGMTSAQGQKNVQHLISLAPAFLSSFSNVLTQSPSSARGYISEAIGAYLRILPGEEVKKTYANISNMLGSSLKELVPQRDREVGPHAIPPVAHSMLDLLIALVPFLPIEQGQQLSDLAQSDILLKNEDAGVQKKTYRILARLMDGNKGDVLLRSRAGTARNVASLLGNLGEATVNVVPGAKRDRLHLLSAIVPRIPSSELHLLPSIIPEGVLATKEANQGSRETAYDLLVQMGQKMQEAGGKIKRNLVDSGEDKNAMQDAESPEVDASLTEYFTMVGAGLAGGSPHMISASITSFSRLVYEFKDDVPKDVLNEIISTIEVFLGSPNREIVKSVLGFVKVAIVSLEFDLVNEHLPTMVPAMLQWSPEHRAHFKAKVRHIFERLIRRFGYDRIVELTDEENRKLVINIKKRKDRAKRKKISREEEEAQGGARDDDDEDGIAPTMGARTAKKIGSDAFEEALYGSESEISDSDSDDDGNAGGAAALARRAAGARQQKGGAANGRQRGQQDSQGKQRRRRDGEDAYLLEDDDNDVPMDLLDRSASAASRIVTGRGGPSQGGAGDNRKRRPGQDAGRFKLDEATGRMVIGDNEDGAVASNEGQGSPAGGNDDFGTEGAYVERQQGLDGHTNTGRGGAVRFNKNNKRTRQQDQEMELAEIAREEAVAAASGSKNAPRKGQKPERERIGREFRAKKARGDVKKGDQDPYAYVPLSQIGGKKASRQAGVGNLDITGRGRGGGSRGNRR
ncbi:unnamed protein product [Sympodiomycopsis kandeliae]